MLFFIYPLKIVRDVLAEASGRFVNENSSPNSTACTAEVSTDRDSEENATADPPAEGNQELLPLPEDELAIVTLEEEYNSPSCTSCCALKSENRQLKNQVKSLQNRLKKKRKDLRKTRSQGVY